jgi:hypothetical protein
MSVDGVSFRHLFLFYLKILAKFIKKIGLKRLIDISLGDNFKKTFGV